MGKRIKKITAFIAVLTVIIMMCGCSGKKPEPVINESGIKTFHISNYTSSIYEGGRIYEAEPAGNGKTLLTIKPMGIPYEKSLKIRTADPVLTELEELVNKYNVISWDGFNKSDANVLDGSSFNLSLEFGDGRTVSASGYMKYPKQYHEFSSEVSAIFERYYDPFEYM